MGTTEVLETPLTRLAGIRYPIVQTGMGFVAGAALAAATSRAGGLGVIASAPMSVPELKAAVAQVKDATDAPFAVNMRSDSPDVQERVDLVIREGVKVASFALAPRRDVIAKLKDAGVVTIPSIGARRHAEKVAEWGVDAVIVQGAEGGGHTGTVPTSLLLPQVVDAVDIPVVAAGGYFDGRGLVSALAYGAAGIAMGTRFLLSADSEVPDAVKQIYLGKSVTDTFVTTAIDGAPSRTLRTERAELLDRSGPLARLARSARAAKDWRALSGTSWLALAREGLAMRRNQKLPIAEILMAANAPMLYRAAMIDGDPRFGVMASGQVVGLIEDLPTVEQIISGVMAEAHEALTRLHTLTAVPAAS
ncbi:NAD(P)H-dependent flavin oxidoreductase [Pseudonocardia lutea]|uniref:NAD(P)H-dependent flavin oxidoreductase n=1 Tax=Pseudonocardia lutea TaxID=2172015 RepID=A0ABW1IDU5_9PSEU